VSGDQAGDDESDQSDQAFDTHRPRAQGLLPYVTAGLPDLGAQLLQPRPTLASPRSAWLPYSDSLADDYQTSFTHAQRGIRGVKSRPGASVSRRCELLLGMLS
jgi:hypothetical protein